MSVKFHSGGYPGGKNKKYDLFSGDIDIYEQMRYDKNYNNKHCSFIMNYKFFLAAGMILSRGLSAPGEAATLSNYTTGSFSQNGGVLKVNKTSGNNIVLSDWFSTAYTFSADFVITETGDNVLSIVFDIDDPARSGTNWMAVSVLPNENKVRIFKKITGRVSISGRLSGYGESQPGWRGNRQIRPESGVT